MLPGEKKFQAKMKVQDIRKNDIIVCYDKLGMLTAPRAYWMFKAMGHEDVHIMNGPFEKWVEENWPLATIKREAFFSTRKRET